MRSTSRRQGPTRVEVELRYQTIGYRWAHNLDDLRRAGAEAILSRITGRCPRAPRSSSRQQPHSSPPIDPEGCTRIFKDGLTYGRTAPASRALHDRARDHRCGIQARLPAGQAGLRQPRGDDLAPAGGSVVSRVGPIGNRSARTGGTRAGRATCRDGARGMGRAHPGDSAHRRRYRASGAGAAQVLKGPVRPRPGGRRRLGGRLLCLRGG